MRFISSFIDSPFFPSETIYFSKKKFEFSNLDFVVKRGMIIKILTKYPNLKVPI